MHPPSPKAMGGHARINANGEVPGPDRIARATLPRKIRVTIQDCVLRMRKSTHAPEYRAVLDLLVAMRKAAGLTQRDLAAKLGREYSMGRITAFTFHADQRGTTPQDQIHFRALMCSPKKRFIMGLRHQYLYGLVDQRIMCTMNTHSRGVMRTNVVIDDQLMAKAQKASHLRTKKSTIEAGLRLLVQMDSQAQLRGLKGSGIWRGNLAEMRKD